MHYFIVFIRRRTKYRTGVKQISRNWSSNMFTLMNAANDLRVVYETNFMVFFLKYDFELEAPASLAPTIQRLV